MNPANLHSIQIECVHAYAMHISISPLITLHGMQIKQIIDCKLHENNVKMALLCLTLLIVVSCCLNNLLVLLFLLAGMRKIPESIYMY